MLVSSSPASDNCWKLPKSHVLHVLPTMSTVILLKNLKCTCIVAVCMQWNCSCIITETKWTPGYIACTKCMLIVQNTLFWLVQYWPCLPGQPYCVYCFIGIYKTLFMNLRRASSMLQVTFSICIHWLKKTADIFTRNTEFSICWTFFACSSGTYNSLLSA